MTVRNAIQEDVVTIVGFQMKMALETEGLTLDSTVLEKGVAAVFKDPTKGRYYVAEEGGAVVASLMITYEWSDWRNGLVWWIQSVYVVPEYRRRGIYAQMYQYVKKEVEASSDVRGIRLYVDKRNVSAQKVYTRLGMDGGHYDTYEWMFKK
jgi:ribosomal protein S18 acetylase RimI-like enzyme